MTPPDSRDKLRKCDCGLVNLSYSDTINADGAMHAATGCKPIRKSDSGEREVPPPHTVQLIPESKRPVLLSQDLAYRILAALEDHKRRPCSHCRALAAELRASVERKP